MLSAARYLLAPKMLLMRFKKQHHKMLLRDSFFNPSFFVQDPSKIDHVLGGLHIDQFLHVGGELILLVGQLLGPVLVLGDPVSLFLLGEGFLFLVDFLPQGRKAEPGAEGERGNEFQCVLHGSCRE